MNFKNSEYFSDRDTIKIMEESPDHQNSIKLKKEDKFKKESINNLRKEKDNGDTM